MERDHPTRLKLFQTTFRFSIVGFTMAILKVSTTLERAVYYILYNINRNDAI